MSTSPPPNRRIEVKAQDLAQARNLHHHSQYTECAALLLTAERGAEDATALLKAALDGVRKHPRTALGIDDEASASDAKLGRACREPVSTRKTSSAEVLSGTRIQAAGGRFEPVKATQPWRSRCAAAAIREDSWCHERFARGLPCRSRRPVGGCAPHLGGVGVRVSVCPRSPPRATVHGARGALAGALDDDM